MDTLVDVYRATYVGMGAHSRLLPHAVEEVKSYISRVYNIIRWSLFMLLLICLYGVKFSGNSLLCVIRELFTLAWKSLLNYVLYFIAR